MDPLTLCGLVIAFSGIFLGQYLEGGDVSMLVNFPALIIVLGGTLGAVILQNSLSILKRSVKIVSWIFITPKISQEEIINKIVEWGKIARRDGLLALEDSAEQETNLVAKKGLSILVDGGNSILLRRVLEVEIEAIEDYDMKACHVFESAGGYCPTIGILGAVLGLIQVMHNLAEPEKLGVGIAIAFVATIYGVGFANLVFLPIGKKIKNIIERQWRANNMLLEGLMSIAEGENPRLTELKLQGFMK